MRILVYGGRGWIGSQLCAELKERGIDYILGNARVDNTLALDSEVRKVAPSHIVSTIGRTSGVYEGERIQTIDYLEKSGKLVENIRDNLFGPLSLAILCDRRGIHLTYLGTGCIFEYDEKHTVENGVGFKEDDLPNFTGSSYSIVKGYTDRLMNFFDDNVLNLRIRMPISAKDNPRDFITKIRGYAKICNMPNSMTVLPDFIPIWISLIESSQTGTYNCVNPGLISHNEILTMYRDIIDPDFTWENFTLDEQDEILLSKRSNNLLDTSTLKREFPEIEPITQAVRRILVER